MPYLGLGTWHLGLHGMGWSNEDVEYDIQSETLYASMADLVGRRNIKVSICNSRFVSYQTSTTSRSQYLYNLYYNSQGTIIFLVSKEHDLWHEIEQMKMLCTSSRMQQQHHVLKFSSH